MASGRRILLIIGGGISAYKSLELIRLLRQRGDEVEVILTKAAEEFVTPLSVASLTGKEAHRGLFDLTREAKMGHISLSRVSDLVVIAPATADLIAKLAHGFANDLASTALLATNKSILIAPAMNVRMWEHPAIQRNIQRVKQDGCIIVGPDEGEMACGEYGLGRMVAAEDILVAMDAALGSAGERRAAPLSQPAKDKHILAGRRMIVTAGPTHEPIDPVRFLANRSSGKQGHAIAAAASEAGAEVIFICGPVQILPPVGVVYIKVETAREMLQAVEENLPAEVLISCAAVSDWRAANTSQKKIKKKSGSRGPTLALVENPDILSIIAKHKKRPRLVIGFAAETGDLVPEAQKKRKTKGCDWILANDVSGSKIFGADESELYFISDEGVEEWPRALKSMQAQRLIAKIVKAL